MATELFLFFNFRSPYCYLASKTMWAVLEGFDVEIVWRPLGGWDGRSPPDRAKAKLPIARQDVSRWCARLGIPFNPPPPTTDPTLAAIGSLHAEKAGLLKPYVTEVMRAEWSHGKDIGERAVLVEIAGRIGLDVTMFEAMLDDPAGAAAIAANAEEAARRNVIGVPTFVVDEEIFWGQDRLDFLAEHLTALRLAKR